MENSRATDNKIVCASQLKDKLARIISNINELERLTINIETVAIGDIEKLQLQTNELLSQVERAPLERISRHVQKRKKRRQKKKLAIRNKIKHCIAPNQLASANISIVTEASTKEGNLDVSVAEAATKASNIKSHQQLRNLSDAQRFLRTFELLKMLHLVRSRDVEATREFGTQFNNLSATWNNVLQENQLQRTQERRIEDQWNEVLFGPNEHVYYGSSGESKLGDMLRVRFIWDSYLTRSKYGTAIPTGWVLPKKTASSAWLQFQAK